MSDFTLEYYFNKYMESDILEEKLVILTDFLTSEEKYIEYFDDIVNLEEVEYFDKFDCQDFMQEHEEEINIRWSRLIDDEDDK